jgi:hypothetical protein
LEHRLGALDLKQEFDMIISYNEPANSCWNNISKPMSMMDMLKLGGVGSNLIGEDDVKYDDNGLMLLNDEWILNGDGMVE